MDRHFRWMAEYGIHGVFLQRFVSELSVPMLRRARDTVADLVRESAEKHGRVFAIMYDVSGACPDTVCSGKSMQPNPPPLQRTDPDLRRWGAPQTSSQTGAASPSGKPAPPRTSTMAGGRCWPSGASASRTGPTRARPAWRRSCAGCGAERTS